MDLFTLRGKVALVTGASRGLGKGMALALAEAGADLALAARTEADLRRTAEEAARFGGRTAVLPEDLADPDAPDRLVQRTLSALGRIDILVTAAGVQVRKPALEMTLRDWDTVINVNLRAVYFLCLAAGRVMIAQGGGKIINVASLTSAIGWPEVSIYGASKGGVAQFSKGLAIEWAPYGVNVNCIGPGTFHTELTDALYRDPERVAAMKKRIPLGRPGVPRDLAGATVFLASPASDYITGQVLYVDGGWLAS